MKKVPLEQIIPEADMEWIEALVKAWTGFDLVQRAARDAAIATYNYCLNTPFEEVIRQRDRIFQLEKQLDAEVRHGEQLAEHWYKYIMALRDIASGKALPQMIAQQILERYPQLNTDEYKKKHGGHSTDITIPRK